MTITTDIPTQWHAYTKLQKDVLPVLTKSSNLPPRVKSLQLSATIYVYCSISWHSEQCTSLSTLETVQHNMAQQSQWTQCTTAAREKKKKDWHNWKTCMPPLLPPYKRAAPSTAVAYRTLLSSWYCQLKSFYSCTLPYERCNLLCKVLVPLVLNSSFVVLRITCSSGCNRSIKYCLTSLYIFTKRQVQK